MKQFIAFVKKEFYHIFRDRRTMLILLGMPVVQIILFGFAISTEVKNVRLAVLDPSNDVVTRKIIDRLDASEYFTVTRRFHSPREMEAAFLKNKIDMVVVFNEHFADGLYCGDARVQLIVDATDPNMSTSQINYATGIVSAVGQEMISPGISSSARLTPDIKLLYNPQMKSAYNFVPGVMGLILMLICAMMTSISIVREKETGTMEVLLVSPVKPLFIILAKAVPYFVLSFVNLVTILLLSVFVLDVPVVGSLFWLVVVSLLFIFVSLSLGLLISSVTRTQVAAMLASGMILMMPTMVLSGMIFPVESMPLILQLISDILDLSKIESGTLEFVMGRIDVNLLCEDLVRSLRMKVSEKVELLFEDYQSEMYIIGDRNRIYQVISNFVNNAIKFTTKGRISVGYYLEGDYLKFYVRDTGVGIAPDKVEHIFDRFIKLDNFVHGTGLGLSICKSLVEQMGGQIGVESEQGKGSCFWFTYPLKNLNQLEAHSNNLNTMEKVSEVVEKKPVILVAEDTDSNFLLVSTILKRDYEIIRAHDGVEAIEFTEKYIPCGILMDIRMPRIDGIEATYKIREMGYDMPIIAVTAFAFDRDRQKMLDAGCNDYITKPLSSAILKSTIKKWLEKEIMF